MSIRDVGGTSTPEQPQEPQKSKKRDQFQILFDQMINEERQARNSFPKTKRLEREVNPQYAKYVDQLFQRFIRTGDTERIKILLDKGEDQKK